ncbi:MAG: hypothetical protein ACRDRP_25870, partial [Pseudonocardiaceae bacterium]
TGDTAARLRAWDQTAPLPEADISINTDHMHPTAAAAAIHNQAQRRESPQRRSWSGRTFLPARL